MLFWRPAAAFEPYTAYQPRRVLLYLSGYAGTGKNPGQSLVRGGPVREPALSGDGPVLNRRKPMLLLRLDGVLLLRFADRTF